jgi:hypothetical protein
MGKYADLRDAGYSPGEIYQVAKADGFGQVECIRLIRAEFGFSLVEAKEVMVVAEGWAASLDEHQARIAAELQTALESLESTED